MELRPSDLFRALGVETRIKIIELLKSRGPIGVTEIAEVIGITPAAVSQHLRVLKHAGLVQSERKGYCIPYSIDSAALENCRCQLNSVCSCGCMGDHGFEEKELEEASLPALMKYKEEIESKLKTVQGKISRIKAQQK
ncbi:ArsR/SmtB family transcription factor [Chloroflexota bacterium]